jgi:hypothetical protein
MITTVIPVTSGQTVYEEYNDSYSGYVQGDIVTYLGSTFVIELADKAN